MTWADRRKIPALLAVATLIPIGALTWLGLRVVQQDRDAERQRRRERLEVAAGRLALDIERRLQDLEEQLARGADDNTAGIHFTSAGLLPSEALPLLYQPEASPGDEPPASAFSAAEAEEFQHQDLGRAEASYRRLAESSQPAVRAAALVRLGRLLRKQGDHAGALQVYADLERLGTVAVSGQPAALIGRQARCCVLEEAGDAEALRREAADLARVLNAGGWQIDRATFELYRDLLQRWGGGLPSPGAITRTEAAIRLWRAWRAGDLAPRGRRLLREDGGVVLAVWAGGPERPVAWLATSGELEASLRPLWTAQDLAVSLYDTDGQPLFGDQRPGSVSLTPSDTRLPFILSVASLSAPDAESDRMRRTVFIGGLLVTMLLMLAAAYGLYRATTRELVVARQQSDFVSAVSHEFRTPLTSMRHLTDLLVSRGVTSEERKAHYYELLAHETERLHRMVESLLSFGRIEAGADAWRLESADTTELLRDTSEEFRREPIANGRQLLCEIEDQLPPIRADREALSRALWNLLENAGKYSEADRPIKVFARRQGDSVLLGVEDRGSGIAPAEREKIFQKFVRGTEAKRAGIRGVGIGLALVKRIVEAHGGLVELESEPGRGSTFTIALPAQARDSGLPAAVVRKLQPEARPSTRSASSGSTMSIVEPSTSSGRPEPVEGRSLEKEA